MDKTSTSNLQMRGFLLKNMCDYARLAVTSWTTGALRGEEHLKALWQLSSLRMMTATPVIGKNPRLAMTSKWKQIFHCALDLFD